LIKAGTTKSLLRFSKDGDIIFHLDDEEAIVTLEIDGYCAFGIEEDLVVLGQSVGWTSAHAAFISQTTQCNPFSLLHNTNIIEVSLCPTTPALAFMPIPALPTCLLAKSLP